MKYRSRTDITGLILEAANGGATKTKIMYKAYLSFAQLRDYLSMLIEKLLLNESINIDSKTFIDGYQQSQGQNSSDMIEPTKMSNYTVDGEPSAEGTRRLIQSETGDIVHQKEIIAMHDGKVYFLFLSGYPTEVAKPETKKVLDHIIKSYKWTSP